MVNFQSLELPIFCNFPDTQIAKMENRRDPHCQGQDLFHPIISSKRVNVKTVPYSAFIVVRPHLRVYICADNSGHLHHVDRLAFFQICKIRDLA